MQGTIQTFQSHLRGIAISVLRDEGVDCSETAECLAELVDRICNYREEGVLLFPTVVVTDDLKYTKSLLQAWLTIPLGRGPRNTWTVRSAMKKCAPLTVGNGWHMYLLRSATQFEYGLLSSPTAPTALSPSEAILGAEGGPLSILVRRIGDRATEVVGGRGRCVVHLSSAASEAGSPAEDIERLAECASMDLENEYRPHLITFLRGVLEGILQRGHGSLIAVFGKDAELPGAFRKASGSLDGMRLEPPLDFGLAYGTAHADEVSSRPEAGYQLQSIVQLLEGMLSTDGILILDTTCRIHGYNFFAQTSDEIESHETIGGARQRAYEILCNSVSRGELVAAYIRSSDGGSKIHVAEAGNA